ncbi:FtsX-like permease family protein [Salinispora vitiensis]|uniref:FtsX-like permease family protein n=1 Tax=Salinispora vitiensis TaxID=999544 RepID=UPI00035C7497|nr:FtsX-like permease family protein [Salinispora vitiensis]
MSAAGWFGSWRVALRITRRSALRHRARSALILLMLFVPAYAGTVLLVSWSNLSGTSAQNATFTFGQADLIVDADSAIAATLPSGSRTLGLTQARTVVHGPDDLRVSDYEATDPEHPLNQGRYVLRSGRAPAGPAEVALTRSMADELGLELGGRLTAGMPQRELTVVGLIDWSRSLGAAGLLVTDDAPLSAAGGKLMVQLPPGSRWSPPEPSSYWERSAPSAAERRIEAAATVLVVSFAGTQVVLLVGAAFTVGAARQRRELALVAAAGATAAQVRKVVVASGMLLGAISATAGVLLGLATFALAGPLIERIADHPLIEVSIPAGQVAVAAVVTLLLAVLAAVLPARALRGRPLRGALGGQRDQSRLDQVALVAGVGLIAVATVALLGSANPEGQPAVLAAGGVALLLGVVMCTPALVRVSAPLARVLPMPARLALRHAVRHRLRTAAAMAAVLGAVAGSVALALAGGARGVATPTQVEARPGQVLVPAELADLLGPAGLARLAAPLPARAVVPLRTAANFYPTVFRDPSDSTTDPTVIRAHEQRDIAVGGAEVVRLVTGRAATTAEVAALDQGDAVVFNDALAESGQVTLLPRGSEPSSAAPGSAAPTSAAATSLPAVVAAQQEYFAKLPGLVVSPATAQRLGLDTQPRQVVIDPSRTPTDAELDRANAVLLQAQLAAGRSHSPATVAAAELGSDTRRSTTMFYLLAGVSVLVTLVASTVAVGLAATELRPDLATMAAVGATGRTRRRIAAAQAGFIVGAGTLLGLISGIGPAAAYVGFNVELRWHVPWPALLAVVLAPPVLAIVAARGLARGGLPRLRSQERSR